MSGRPLLPPESDGLTNAFRQQVDELLEWVQSHNGVLPKQRSAGYELYPSTTEFKPLKLISVCFCLSCTDLKNMFISFKPLRNKGCFESASEFPFDLSEYVYQLQSPPKKLFDIVGQTQTSWGAISNFVKKHFLEVPAQSKKPNMGHSIRAQTSA